jgi:hypothetical protein
MLQVYLQVLPRFLHPLVLVYTLDQTTLTMFRKSWGNTALNAEYKLLPSFEDCGKDMLSLLDLYSLDYLSFEQVKEVLQYYFKDVDKDKQEKMATLLLVDAFSTKQPVLLVQWLLSFVHSHSALGSLENCRLHARISVEELENLIHLCNQHAISISTVAVSAQLKFQHLFERACTIGNEKLVLHLCQNAVNHTKEDCILYRLYVALKWNLDQVVKHETQCLGIASRIREGKIILVFPSTSYRYLFFKRMKRLGFATGHILHETIGTIKSY